MTETRDFHLGDILSVAAGMILSPSGMDGIYNILHWMTGGEVMTHQLRRAVDGCKRPLLDQHPDLAAIVIPDGLHGDQWTGWLTDMCGRYGETRPVARLTPGVHEQLNPINELQAMAPRGSQLAVFMVPDGAPERDAIADAILARVRQARGCSDSPPDLKAIGPSSLARLFPIAHQIQEAQRAEQRRVHVDYRRRQMARRRRRRG